MLAESDRLKLLALKQGDEKVFESVFHEYYQPLCIHARRFLIDPEMAEEVVQDMFFKLWERRNSIVINTSLNSYLYKAVTNHAINFLKYNQHLKKYQDFVGFRTDYTQNESAHEVLMHSDLQKKLNDVVLEMPEKRRMIFEMNRFEGLKYAEIAKKLNISLKTVEAQMSKALDFMRDKLQDYLP
ncbi:MAG: RNA polymerase sigma-70 factor [Lentimicrobium sp.]|nr:RNA polymerase sigma-70 factor [Lentimicrobium sp.]